MIRNVRAVIADVVRDARVFADLQFDDKYIKRHTLFEYALKRGDFGLFFKREGNAVIMGIFPLYVVRGYQNMARTEQGLDDLELLLQLVRRFLQEPRFTLLEPLREL